MYNLDRVCEKCGLVFALGILDERVCPECKSHFVRKRRDFDPPVGGRTQPEDYVPDEGVCNEGHVPVDSFFEGAIPVELKPDERRYRIVKVPARLVFQLIFNSSQRIPDYFLKFYADDLPPDTMLVGVHLDQYTNCFYFTVSHPSFDPVPECEPPPFHGGSGNFRWERIPTAAE